MRTSGPPRDLADELGKTSPFLCPEQEAYLNLVRTHEHLAGDFARLFKQHGLSDPQYNALRILRGEGKPMQVYQIAERMVTPQTDITRLVVRLEKAGLVERQRCGEDRRVVWVTLTDRGKAVLRKLDRPVKELHETHFRQLNERELKSLNQLLFRSRHPA
jgi:MarR family transcriptional regulator, 2-MHQ and catechol-resistance regulon repressor